MKSNVLKSLIIFNLIFCFFCGIFDKELVDTNSSEDLFSPNFTFDSLSNSKYRSEEEKESVFSAKEAPKNNWKSGFIFDKFEIKEDVLGKDYKNYGNIYVYPDKFPDPKEVKLGDKKGKNRYGFLIHFPDVFSASKVKDEFPFVHFVNDSLIIIPWRFFKDLPRYINPMLSSKTITANIIDDKEKEYVIRFTLPYKNTGWYISNQESRDICDIIHRMSELQNNFIKNKKIQVRKNFANLQINSEMKNSVEDLENQLQERVNSMNNKKSELVKTLNNILNTNNKLNPLRIKKKVIMDRNFGLNEKIEVDQQKIQEIKNNDPNREKRAEENLNKNKKLLNDEMKKLEIIAQDKKIDIEAANDAVSMYNQNEMEIHLRNIGPLSSQVE